ncbi:MULTISPECIES: DUF3616 domain-containing protein [Methylomonas]|uniref:DUF3616 domain-containing protein n=2 Tax=Methylomonas TaxID=416 RepID=A0A126T6X3_9GAMM|nr:MULTISPECIES: DUF3616 domain-containing protein [Methylomonas]AMK77835.1 hypothetical protein JT25_015355 [Methylomonas denitrificans]OAI00941.1 hypothetical protein A1342_16295 [Methylomonas methanica]TCV87006.1 uncharacterized protein DUF3616 [Methylomonas methanica]
MDIKTYKGRSNVSGAIALNDRYFIVADDEDNELSVFDKNAEKATKPAIALSEVFDGEIEDGKHQEIDLEGGARIGDIYFWIGSHSTNSEGDERRARRRLFGIHLTEVEPGKFSAQRYGSIYTQLIADLKQDQRFARYDWEQAEHIQPKGKGGLSIEGLTATPKNGLLIGFRNPLAGGDTENGFLKNGKAILVHLLNPLALLQGQAAQFAEPIELDLDGLGIRDIAWRQDHQYLIVAGPYHANEDRLEKHWLCLWDSDSGKLTRLDRIDLGDLNIEAAFFFPGQNDRVELLSDDGEQKGFQCVSVAL